MACKAPFVCPSEIIPSLGDLIEFDRCWYSHWAIYVGGGDVVHISQDGAKEVTVSCTAFVFQAKLYDVAAGSLVRVNNKEESARQRFLTARNPRQVVAIAKSCVGMPVEYTLLEQNCEYYVTLWKYGEGWSDQVNAQYWIDRGAEWAVSDPGKITIGVGVGIAALGLLAGYLLFSNDNRQEKKHSSH